MYKIYKCYQAGLKNEDILQDIIWPDIFSSSSGPQGKTSRLNIPSNPGLHTDRFRHVYKGNGVHFVFYSFNSSLALISHMIHYCLPGFLPYD